MKLPFSIIASSVLMGCIIPRFNLEQTQAAYRERIGSELSHVCPTASLKISYIPDGNNLTGYYNVHGCNNVWRCSYIGKDVYEDGCKEQEQERIESYHSNAKQHIGYSVKREFDKFTNSYTWDVKTRDDGWMLRIYLHNNKQIGVGLMFVSVAKSWKYLECHFTLLRANNSNLPVAQAEHSGSVGEGYVLEIVKLELTEQNIDHFLANEIIEYKLCQNEGVLPQQMITLFKTTYQQIMRVAKPTFVNPETQH